uniref:Uncharacterized protein n=1 Tax=Mucochytrium quahogii TaxID=96639 RepID=A0A7S2WU24_9STRA|mmetsp:Transcript_4293/g.6349  ORF Transcript_4293/g.6349 Transcript_4293/m.6349 type:complete len:411 (+) Transcript_4293:296-1528(+)|eukprot:CAMPEP_0203767876 /NCGR_PEP_ID=MMETSP0099_2-20121227/1254_1 /ASSEMBLY_ACC=CAM_ASM_000209 /TAXON_ID=96639 /ORGANISM=" , Strain NY0313808BC1" /LENGTH=410 /DNA_ID=CAMNT_0050664461 /DNA_START=182 /DNA_END=1414 /DNA_ORIENTATION=+
MGPSVKVCRSKLILGDTDPRNAASLSSLQLGGPDGIQATKLCMLRQTNDGNTGYVVALGCGKSLALGLAQFPEQAFDTEQVKGVKNPVPATIGDTVCLKLGESLENRIQSVSARGELVAASDSQCGCIVARVSTTIDNLEDLVSEDCPSHKLRRIDSASVVARKSSATTWVGDNNCMKGWTGVALSPTLPTVAVTSSLGRKTVLRDIESGTETGEFWHDLNPMALSYYNENCLVIGEWGTLTLWDTREGKKLKFANAPLSGRAPIYSISADTSRVAVVGESKSLSLLDTRTWKSYLSWKVPIKHDAVGVKLTGNASRCFVAGLDHELVGFSVDEMNKKGCAPDGGSREKLQTPQSLPQGSMLHQNHRMFRSEATWAGFDVFGESLCGSSSCTEFVGLSTSSVLYTGHYSF